LGRPDYASRAREVGARLRQENGAGRACDLIEQVLRETEPVLAHDPKEPSYAVSD
jgi:hypothetical protein